MSFAVSGSVRVKAARKMLVKLTLVDNLCNSLNMNDIFLLCKVFLTKYFSTFEIFFSFIFSTVVNKRDPDLTNKYPFKYYVYS